MVSPNRIKLSPESMEKLIRNFVWHREDGRTSREAAVGVIFDLKTPEFSREVYDLTESLYDLDMYKRMDEYNRAVKYVQQQISQQVERAGNARLGEFTF